MPIMTTYAHGQFSWVDLSAIDMAEAKRFYAEVFGWSVEDQDTGGAPPYAIFTNDGHQVAGLGQMSDEIKAQAPGSCWNSYINVDDAEAAAKKAEGLGAKVLFPVMKVMEAGWMTFLTDPSGAPFAIWQKNTHIGAQQVNDPGSFSWNELATRDLEKSKAFYGALFGWTFEENTEGRSKYFIASNRGKMSAGLIEMTKEWGEVPPHWAVYFTVKNVDRAAATIKKMGGKAEVEPFDISIGRIAVMADPHGGHFNIYQAKTG